MEAVDRVMPTKSKNSRDDEIMEPIEEVIMHQRMQNLQNDTAKNQNNNKNNNLPSELLRR